MNITFDNLVKAVVPDFPADREVKASRDVVSWYKVIWSSRTLMVPPLNVVKNNMRELDRFVESVKAFATMDFSSPMYKWDACDLNLQQATGHNVAAAIDQAHHYLLTGRGAPGSAVRTDAKNRAWVSCDIETRRVEWEDNRLLSLGFGLNDNTALALFDCDWKSPSIHKALQDLFRDPELMFIWHNGKFDCTRLKWLENIDARIDQDTMLQHYACINEKQGTHGLKEMSQLYLQAPAWEDELEQYKREWCRQNRKPLKEFMYDDIPTETLIPYMQRDCIATYRLHDVFNKLTRPGSEFIYSQLIRASNVFLQIELTGQRLDIEYLEELEYDLEQRISKAQAKLDAVSEHVWNPELYKRMTGAKSADAKFNPSSPKQLKWMLQELLGYPVPSTDATMLATLLAEVESGKIDNPDAKDFIEAIGDIRKYSKYLETYVLGMRDVVCRDQRVRCTFNLHGTETGRLSSSGPNMQNIPRNKLIRNLLVATPGWKFLQLDYSQVELRVLAMLSGDPALIKIYQEGKDLHDAVADMMFGEGAHLDKEKRNLAKTINFGIAYGRGPSSIAEKFGKSMAESRQIIEQWFKPMPKVREFINNRRRMATRGEPCVTLLGRLRHFVITNEELNHIQNEYINTPIQSLASDFTLLSLLSIHDYIEEHWKGKARITTTVHDSILLEVVDGDPELMLTIAKKCIQIMAETPLKYVPDCPVPFVADADIGYKWGELSALDMQTGLEKTNENS